ncbi:hypothetical protein EVAR_11650_1 [Eumeta japonica]|uniref:Uncharacterized protein n=1 Tax=Eumeta variegata TaxID=151549 RepID=A0A4C1WTR0_EUMVA|nr:hypothetical protein EVAR_11650_1 [Eumeta japonica]
MLSWRSNKGAASVCNSRRANYSSVLPYLWKPTFPVSRERFPPPTRDRGMLSQRSPTDGRTARLYEPYSLAGKGYYSPNGERRKKMHPSQRDISRMKAIPRHTNKAFSDDRTESTLYRNV